MFSESNVWERKEHIPETPPVMWRGQRRAGEERKVTKDRKELDCRDTVDSPVSPEFVGMISFGHWEALVLLTFKKGIGWSKLRHHCYRHHYIIIIIRFLRRS